MTDEELARALQQEEEDALALQQEEDALAEPEPRIPTAPEEEDDAALAARLQAEWQREAEHEEAEQHQPVQQNRAGEMRRLCCDCVHSCRHRPVATGMMCLGATLNTGAAIGCCTGFQVAATFGLGKISTLICSVVGGVAGHAQATWGQQGPPPGQAYYRRMMAQHEESSSEDEDLGLEPEVIEGYTIESRYRQPLPGGGPQAQDGADDGKCMVCMETFNEGEALRTLPCLHRYHAACVDQWLQRRPECPICKRDIREAQVVPVAQARPARRGFSLWRRRSSS